MEKINQQRTRAQWNEKKPTKCRRQRPQHLWWFTLISACETPSLLSLNCSEAIELWSVIDWYVLTMQDLGCICIWINACMIILCICYQHRYASHVFVGSIFYDNIRISSMPKSMFTCPTFIRALFFDESCPVKCFFFLDPLPVITKYGLQNHSS